MCQLCQPFDGAAPHCLLCHGWHLELWCEACLDSWRRFADRYRRAGWPADRIRAAYEQVAHDEADLEGLCPPAAAPLPYQLFLAFYEEPPVSADDIEAALRHRAAWSLAALLCPSVN